MKLLVDMNLSPRWVHLMREAGHDARHWSEVGDPTAPDSTIMRVAAEQHAVLLSNDLDFRTMLAASGADGPSVVQVRASDLRPDVLGQLVLDALVQMAAELEAGALITVQAGSARLRMLPFARRGTGAV
ncbi:MAG: DUF5615 family PIN-like protein [Candidatus Nanopelagicales bacterium]